MLTWSLTFLFVAIIAAIFGFTGLAAGAAWIAKVIFFLFVVAFGVSFIWGLMSGRPIRPKV